jgi:hypothetical protein
VEAEDNSDGRYFLNIFAVHEEASEKDIREFYKHVAIVKVHPAMPGAFDLEFSSKEDLIRAIDTPDTFLLKQPFYIRSSYFKTRDGRGRDGPRGGRFRGDRDRGDRDRADRGDRDRGRRDRYERLSRFEGDPEDRDKFAGFRDRPRGGGDGYREKDAPAPRRWEDREPQQATSSSQAGPGPVGGREREREEQPGASKAGGLGASGAGPDRSGVVKSRGALT